MGAWALAGVNFLSFCTTMSWRNKNNPQGKQVWWLAKLSNLVHAIKTSDCFRALWYLSIIFCRIGFVLSKKQNSSVALSCSCRPDNNWISLAHKTYTYTYVGYTALYIHSFRFMSYTFFDIQIAECRCLVQIVPNNKVVCAIW